MFLEQHHGSKDGFMVSFRLVSEFWHSFSLKIYMQQKNSKGYKKNQIEHEEHIYIKKYHKTRTDSVRPKNGMTINA